MASGTRRAVFTLVTLGLMLAAGNASADAIDGTWCFKDGRHLTIDGPKIVTPGGSRIEGDYGRHDFAYVVPARETGAGTTVTMMLVDDETMHVTAGKKPGPPAEGKVQVWRRCELTT